MFPRRDRQLQRLYSAAARDLEAVDRLVVTGQFRCNTATDGEGLTETMKYQQVRRRSRGIVPLWKLERALLRPYSEPACTVPMHASEHP